MPPAGRRTRSDVVDAALAILDEQGLPDLTMRRIADRLDLQVGALYRHFPDKQTLLAAVGDRILAPVVTGSHGGLRAAGSRLHDRLLAYRDGAETVSSSLALGLVGVPIRPFLVDRAREEGASPSTADAAAETVLHYVIGYTFHEQQRMHADALGLVRDAGLRPDGAAPPTAGSVVPVVSGFARGLDLIVAGLRATTGTRA